MRISQQQASGGGRLILAFKNTPMQYARIIKRSTQDLIAGRGDWKTNVSKIVYYGAAQNIIFNGLQNAVWTEAFDEDGDGTEKGARTANGMVDSLLGGLGFQGSAAVAIKNSLITIAKESGKDSPEFRKAVNDLLDFSPPILFFSSSFFFLSCKAIIFLTLSFSYLNAFISLFVKPSSCNIFFCSLVFVFCLISISLFSIIRSGLNGSVLGTP